MYCEDSMSREPRNPVTVAVSQLRLKKPRTSIPHGRNSTTLNTTCRVTREVSIPVVDSPAVWVRMSCRKWKGTNWIAEPP
ncbi:Uncharacterised protein [Rothia kristinae]|nr:Uncharacterised protein [Rothia kristinae]